jgi:hypothetical protein
MSIHTMCAHVFKVVAGFEYGYCSCLFIFQLLQIKQRKMYLEKENFMLHCMMEWSGID